MIKEMTAEELNASCRTFVSLRAKEQAKAKTLLGAKYARIEETEDGALRVYDAKNPEEIVAYLCENGVFAEEIGEAKISLEEYYIDLMKE